MQHKFPEGIYWKSSSIFHNIGYILFNATDIYEHLHYMAEYDLGGGDTAVSKTEVVSASIDVTV